MVWTRGTWDFVTELEVIAQLYRVIHYGFVAQNLLQVAVHLIAYIAHQIHPECSQLVYERD